MSFATALGYFLGGQGEAKRQARQDASQKAYNQGQLDIERTRAGEQQRLDDASLAGLQQGNEQTTRNRQFESGLKLPPNWSQLKPDQQYNYLGVRYSKALQAGDTAAAKATLDQMNSIPRAGNEFANTQLTTQGKLPLDQAQAGYYRNRLGVELQKTKMELQGRMQVADAQTRARMAAAQLSASTRLQAAGMGNDEREYIATMTALNAANRQDSSQAFNEAMAQYRNASAQWQNQQRAYLKSGTAPPGFDPASPPQAQTFIDNVQPSSPITVNVSVPTPGGGVRNITVPVPTPPRARHDPQKAKELVEVSRANGFSDQNIARKMQSMRYRPEEIKEAMQGALKMQGGGF